MRMLYELLILTKQDKLDKPKLAGNSNVACFSINTLLVFIDVVLMTMISRSSDEAVSLAFELLLTNRFRMLVIALMYATLA